MKQTRLPEIIGSALKLAREKRGLERGELATQCCLSSKMILELEEGGMTSFYNFQLKLSSAKRVGTFLGLSASDYLENLTEAIESIAIPAEKKNLADLEVEDLPQENATDKEHVQPVEPAPATSVVDEGEQLDDLIYESTHSGSSMPYVATRTLPFKKIGIVLGLIVVIGGLYGLENQFQVASSAFAFVENFRVKKIEAQAPPAEPVAQEPPVAVEESSAQKTQVKPEAIVAALPVQNQCPPARDEAPIYKSPNPSKVGDSVNIKTMVTQSICVADGQGRQSRIDLEPNMAHSFRGVSPFVVSAQDLDNVEMYFQGWRVRPPSPGIKQIKLVETAMQ